MKRIITGGIFALLFIFAIQTVQAATVGKIVGRVVDKESGDPLPGCNVIVVNTSMGAATDADGYYVIVNVPPGNYDVKASMIGYQSIQKNDVRVTMDKTTQVSFSLGVQAIEGETVEVTAERPLVEKDVTVKKMVMTEAEIRTAPVQDLTDMLTLQSGIIAIENQSYGIPGFAERGVEQIHVRGGRSGEIGYIFDGMYIENPTYGGIGKGTRLNKYAVSEVVTETGVFNAEYGDALSSMVNWVTKTGDFQEYEGIFRYRTSEIGGAMVERRNDFLFPSNLQGLKDFAGAFGGPIPFLKGKASFFVSGEVTGERSRVLEFDDQTWTEGPIPGNHPINPKVNYSPPYNPNDPDDRSDPLDTQAGWAALGHENTADLFTKLAFRISPNMNLTFTNWIVDTDMKFFSNSGESVMFRYYPRGKNHTLLNSDRQSLEWRHQISSKTFYTVRMARFWQRRRYRVKNHDSDSDGYNDWLETRLDTDPYNGDPDDEKAVPKDRDGDGYPDDVEDNPTILRSDIETPLLDEDAAKDPNITPDQEIYPLGNDWLKPWQYNGWVGVAPYYNFIREGAGRYWHHSYTDTYEMRVDVTSQVSRHHQVQVGVDGKYHDLYFNEVQLPWLDQPYTDRYHKYPREFAGYIQDKIEYPYMTINVGLRLDASNNNTTAWDDPNDPTSEIVKTETEYNWSPRLGISHVITDKATFTFGYGIFHQNPIYRNIYVNSDRDLTTFSPIVGNPLIGSQKLTAYEFGIKNQFTDEYAVSVVGWTKEYSELDATERVPAFPFSYTISKGIDYGVSRGFDVTLEKINLYTNWAGRLTYTYSVAKANRADPWEGYRNTDTPETMPKREILMNYDRTHDFSIIVGYRIPEDQGLEVMDYKLFNRTRWDAIFYAQSGAPYTPTIEGIPQETNSERMPWIHQLNLSFQKQFSLQGLNFRLGLQIDNIFDRKNVIDVYPETGRPDDPGRRANNRIAQGLNSDTAYDMPFFYGPRRSIQFTTEVEF